MCVQHLGGRHDRRPYENWDGEWLHPWLPPEVLEPIRRQLGVAHRVLDVLVPKPCLQRPGVVATIG
jgi:hypothetical protein